MSFIVPWSIVILVHRWEIYLTVCTHNWSEQFTYIACNGKRKRKLYFTYINVENQKQDFLFISFSLSLVSRAVFEEVYHTV